MQVNEWLGEDNQIGIDIWKNKYPHSEESFDNWVDRVSNGNEELKKLIISKKFLFGGRILSNRGLHKSGKKVTYSNCYVVSPPEDNIESIFDCAKALARTFSYGGGVGVDISKLAPCGAKVNNTAKATSGAVSFMDLYSHVTELIGQNGRRGALMISLDCHHPDLENFIEIKSDLDKVTKANISIRVTDDFLQAVKNNEDFKLSFTREETNETIEKTVKAKEIFYKFCEMNWDYAEPAFLFWNRIENWNLLSKTKGFKFAGTNPCVSGDTLILTDKGYIRIDNLINQEVNVWNGYKFSTVVPKITGYNQKMKRISFSDGSKLDCTNYHKFILKDKSRIKADTLKIGDKLVKCNFPIINGGNEIDDKIAYTQGFYMGDGSSETNRDRLSIKLHKEKRKVINRIIKTNVNYCKSFDGEFVTLPFEPNAYNKEFVPDVNYNINSRLSWLAGYIDSDGTLQSKDGALSISSINLDILTKVKYLLNTLGCTGTISVMRDKGKRLLPKNDGTNDKELLYCQKSYRLLINATNVKKLMDLGIKLSRVELISNPNRDAGRFIQVTNIEEIDDCDIVYCFNEPDNHSGIFNGVITAQCAEEPLPAGGSCLLGSINLSEFVINGMFDFDDFGKTVRIATRALNEVLDEGLPLHPLKEQRDSVKDWRQIGLGIFGLADMLIKLELTYGNKESLALCDEIGKVMINEAIKESAYLAQEYGTYPKYNYNDVATTEFYKYNVDTYVDSLVKKYGLRNSQLLTIAPTGSLSTMLGVSGGIEPIFANYYTRKTESLHNKEVTYKVYTSIVKTYMDNNNIVDDSELPEFFITAQQLDYPNRIDMQSIWQSHIDASISSTINVPNKFTVEEVEDLYLYAWKQGLKGITIFRDGCKRLGILTTPDNTDDEKQTTLQRGDILCVNDDLLSCKRTVVNGCGKFYIHCDFDEYSGEALETFIEVGSGGGCERNLQFISRLISLLLRAGVPIEEIIDQAQSIRPCKAYTDRTKLKGDTSKGTSCPSAIGNALKELQEKIHNRCFGDDVETISDEDIKVIIKESPKISLDNTTNENLSKCPDCGAELFYEGGCDVCKECGYSHCG